MAKVSTGRRGPTAVNSHVGQKIRARRMFLRIGQTEVLPTRSASLSSKFRNEDDPRRRSLAKLLTRDDARQIAANIAKLPDQLTGNR